MFAVSKQGEDPVPEGAVRLFKLPMGGWLVRTAKDIKRGTPLLWNLVDLP